MEHGRFPNKLKKYRHIAGLSQKKVAKALGFADTSVISRWEHGAVLPSMLHVFTLAKLYQTLPHMLYDQLWNTTPVDGLSLISNSVNAEEDFYL